MLCYCSYVEDNKKFLFGKKKTQTNGLFQSITIEITTEIAKFHMRYNFHKTKCWAVLATSID